MLRFQQLRRVAGHTLLIVAITCGLAECTYRVYQHMHPTFLFAARSYNRFRGQPGAPEYDFQLNSRGFKDVEFPPTKASDATRLLALGDSFAFGVVPYASTYLTLLEQHLTRDGRRMEVLNMGIPGIGPPGYLALLMHEGLALQPDIVLVSFFIGNDFTDTRAARRPTLATYSHVLALLHYVLALQRTSPGHVIHGRAVYDDTAPTLTDAAYLALATKSSWIYMKRTPFKPAFAEQTFAEAVGALVRIKAVCDARKIALRVVLIPDELQVNPALQAQVHAALHVGATEVDFTLPNRFLQAQFQAAHIDYLDLLDSFVAATAQQNLYKPNDTHWNIAGNALAAELLAQYIVRQFPGMP